MNNNSISNKELWTHSPEVPIALSSLSVNPRIEAASGHVRKRCTLSPWPPLRHGDRDENNASARDLLCSVRIGYYPQSWRQPASQCRRAIASPRLLQSLSAALSGKIGRDLQLNRLKINHSGKLPFVLIGSRFIRL
jgi:hypothetical protein